MTLPKTSTIMTMAISKDLLLKVKTAAVEETQKRGHHVSASELMRESFIFKYGGGK